MALRKIVYMPDPVLRRKAHKITDFGQDFQVLVDDMLETLRDAPGVGLAAPQIAVSQRLIVVEYGENEEEDEAVVKKLYVVANPEIIIPTTAEQIIGSEACLSVPGLAGEVERFTQITVKGQNRRGQALRLKLEGWTARIFQHEIDHLDGIMFVDRAVRVWKLKENEEALLAD
jgi:peptide deformylase